MQFSLGSFRNVAKRPPISQENKLSTLNVTQTSLSLQQSYCLPDKQNLSPSKANYVPNSRSKSLATLGDITNMKYNTPVKDIPVKVPIPSQTQVQLFQSEIIDLAARIQDLAKNSLQNDKDLQLEGLIEKEKLKKQVQDREVEIEDLARHNHNLTDTLHQRDDQISELLHELRVLEQKLVDAQNFMKQMNEDHHIASQRMTQEIQDKNNVLDIQSKQITSLNEELFNKQKIEQSLKMELQQALDEGNSYRRGLDESNQLNEDLNAKVKDLQTIKTEHERIIKQLRFDLDEHQRRVNLMDNELVLLHQRNEETNQELSTWINKFQHLDRGHQSHIEEMRKQFEMETQKKVDLEVTKCHQKMQIEIQQFESRHRMELNRVNEQETILRDLQREREQLLEENRCKDLDIEDMKNEISTLSKIELDNRKMVAHIQYLEGKLESIVQDGQRTRQFTEDFRHKVSQKERSLAEQLSKLQQEREMLEQIINKTNKDNQSLILENQQIITDLHGTQAELQKTRVQNEEFQTSMKLMQEDIRNLQVYRQRCHELQQNQEKREDVNFCLNNQYRMNQLQEQYNVLKLEYNNLQQMYNNMRANDGEARANRMDLRREQNIREDVKVRYYEENSRHHQR